MKSITLPTWRQNDIWISFVVWVFLVVFTYGVLYLVPYPGFYFNPTDGAVTVIFEDRAPASVPHLEIGDVLKKVGPVRFEDYSNNLTVNLFENYKPNDILEIDVERDGKRITVPWVYAGFTSTEFFSHLFNIWWLAYIFWFIGMTTQIFMRPKDKRWGLFVAANYLTGVFIMLGTVSSFGFLSSAFLLRVVAWLMLPVYLHFHWIFPRSLRPVPRWLKFASYFVCGLLALLQLFSVKPSPLYFLAIILAFGGSILLLIAHAIFQPEYRRELRILAIAAVFSLGLTVIAGVVASSGSTPRSAVLALLTLPILPVTYFYVLYRQSLGGLELRANRVISLYVFLVILGIALLLLVGSSGLRNVTPDAFPFAAIMIALVTTFIAFLIFPAFQRGIERRLLGIKLPAQNMVESYSARIITSNSFHELLKLLEEEVFPSLFIRQYAFVQIEISWAKIILSRGVDLDQIPGDALMDQIASASAERLPPSAKMGPPLEWVHLALPLWVGHNLIGAWLLGRRDPDDHYSQAELPILWSLANQTAIALSNLIQTNRLKVMYEANIHRYEQERLRLARDLHDSLLNEMAAMLMKQDPADLPPGFQQSFDGLIVRLREIVTDLRPPMLLYGLKSALDGLADNLSERNQDMVMIGCELQATDPCRYPETVEQNIYRIVQEACENALKYARAKAIRIGGELSPAKINIQVTDDGIGFKDELSLSLDEMVANKHYGLAGMYERADLIGANILIDSRQNLGTQIQVLWEGKDAI